MPGNSGWRWSLAVLLIAILVACHAAGHAQEPKPDTPDAVAPIRIDAVVTDANGRPIVDLRPSDFEFLETGRAPHRIDPASHPPERRQRDESIETKADEERPPDSRVPACSPSCWTNFTSARPCGGPRARRVSEFIDQT